MQSVISKQEEDILNQDFHYLSDFLEKSENKYIIQFRKKFAQHQSSKNLKKDIDKSIIFSDEIFQHYKFLIETHFSSDAWPILQKMIEKFQELQQMGFEIEIQKLQYFIILLTLYEDNVKVFVSQKNDRVSAIIKECLKKHQ